MKKDLQEFVVNELPRRCPYCDAVVSYDRIPLKKGENPIQCPACKKTYIRIVSDLPDRRKRK